MVPRMDQPHRIERLHDRPNLVELEQTRARRHQETDRELDRRDVINQVESPDLGQQLTICRQRGPRGKGHKRRHQHHTDLAAERDGALDVGTPVALGEPRQDRVVERFDGARDEHAPGVTQPPELGGVTQQVLNLDRHVVRQVGKLACQGMHDAHRVTDAVEEIRVAERHVLGAPRHLRPDVGQHHLRGHDAEPTVVDRHDRTVPAPMLAPTTRLRVADDLACRPALQRGVSFERGQPAAVRRDEREARQPVGDPLGSLAGRLGPTHGDLDEIGLELASQNVTDAQRPQPRRVQRGIQPIAAEDGVRVEGPHPLDDRHGEARGRMHGQMESHQIGFGQLHAKRLARQVDTSHLDAGPPQPCRRRSQAERLATHLVGCNQDGVHRLV